MNPARGKRWRAARTLVALLPLLAAVGCWNSQDIQNQAYVTAIGLDYADGKYNVYAQVLNFGNVARSEKGELGKALPVWYGHAAGETMSSALGSLHLTSQLPLYWGHTKVIVVTERFMKERGVDEAIQAMNRYREIRYNIYAYGTREKLETLFVQTSIFNLSPLDTIMFSPKQIYRPITGNRFIAKLNEPGNPAALPSIGLDASVWNEDRKSKPMLRIDGAYYFTNKRLASRMSEQELKGARWAQRSLRNTVIKVPLAPPFKAGIMVTNAKLVAKPKYKDGKPTFDIRVKAKGFVIEMLETDSVSRLERLAEDALRTEIRETFLKGVSLRCDPFALQQTFYRKYPHRWKSLGGPDEFQLRPDSIARIDVKFTLTHMGKYKGRTH